MGTAELLIVCVAACSFLVPDYFRGGLSLASVVVVGSLSLGMIATPPDPLSMLVVAIPLLLAVASAIWLYGVLVRRQSFGRDHDE